MRISKIILILFVVFIVFLLGIGTGAEIEKRFIASKNAAVKNVNPAGTSANNQDFVGYYKVQRVIDGDTIELVGGEYVRYIGMDTPETVDPNKPVECFGLQAAEENKKLVENKIVRLEKDTSQRDKYGRLLRYIYVGSDFINLYLVKSGFARVAVYPPDIKYENQFLMAQHDAQKSKLGLWMACPVQ